MVLYNVASRYTLSLHSLLLSTLYHDECCYVVVNVVSTKSIFAHRGKGIHGLWIWREKLRPLRFKCIGDPQSVQNSTRCSVLHCTWILSNSGQFTVNLSDSECFCSIACID